MFNILRFTEYTDAIILAMVVGLVTTVYVSSCCLEHDVVCAVVFRFISVLTVILGLVRICHLRQC